MSDLPADLVEEILSRIPANSLKRLRSTCKRWSTLFKDPRFTKKHFCKAPKQSMILMLKKYRIYPVSVNLNVAPPYIELKDALDLKDPHSYSEEQVDISEVFHCDGLLLYKTTEHDRIVVWNPCLGETRWIQPKTAYKNYSRFALGYQNNKSCRSYKILRYWHNYKPDPIVGCEIYEFSSDTWRILDDINPNCYIRPNGVSLKGDTYWLALDADDYNISLLCFNFTIERFRRMSLPLSQNNNCVVLSLVREEQLSVLHWVIDTSKMEIWVTNKVDTKDALWSKLFTIDLHTKVSASLLIDEEKKVALCCDEWIGTKENMVYTIGEDGEYYTEIHSIESTNPPWVPFIFNYVPSLVQIQ